MLVHAYLTDGFFPMAEMFLLSLRVAAGNAPPYVWLDTRGLDGLQIAQLKTFYPDGMLHVANKRLPLREWAARAGVPVGTMKQYKKECEQRFVSNNNKVWKLMTAGDDRVQALYDIVWNRHAIELPAWDTPPRYVAHFDIDTLFRKPLTGFVKMMAEHDIWIKLRRGHPTMKARITIDMILMNGADNVRLFFDRWRHHINRVQPADRPVGWGQASCWHAFTEVETKLNYGTLPLKFGLPGRNAPDDVIWTGNVHRLAKTDFTKLCRRELEKWSA